MHAGNIYAALFSWLIAKSQDGEVVLRIEDLDRERSKPEFINALMHDFEALGLFWDKGPYYQSSRSDVYADALHELKKKHRIYPCFCTRADLHAASAPHRGEKPIYAGTCRGLSSEEVSNLMIGRAPSWRLQVPDVRIQFQDAIQGVYAEDLAYDCGDFVLRRADGAYAYQLAVVVDDADQGVNSIVRGVDLLDSTPQQIFLRESLGIRMNVAYAHVPLLVAEAGRRLSKRDKDASLDELFLRFGTPQAIIGHIAFLSGISDFDEPTTPEQLLQSFDLKGVCSKLSSTKEISWR